MQGTCHDAVAIQPAPAALVPKCPVAGFPVTSRSLDFRVLACLIVFAGLGHLLSEVLMTCAEAFDTPESVFLHRLSGGRWFHQLGGDEFCFSTSCWAFS